MSIALSLIIPAYDEAERLPAYLHAIRLYLGDSIPGEYEVIVVDDGSRDRTADVVGRLFEDWDQFSVLRLPANRGKGAAVRAGVLAARGQLVLFADADGATPIEDERKLRALIDNGADLAVGSRYLKTPGTTRPRRRGRRDLVGRLFARLARRCVRAPIRDVQCGFKMFRRDVGLRLFEVCSERGYLFDVFILALADRLGYQIEETAIRWSEVPGSKVHLVRDSWRMLTGLPRVRRSVAAEAARAPRAAAARHREAQDHRDGTGDDEAVPGQSALVDAVDSK